VGLAELQTQEAVAVAVVLEVVVAFSNRQVVPVL
jgi:hypothetical protein